MKLKIGLAVSDKKIIKFFKNLKTPKISENIDSGLIFYAEFKNKTRCWLTHNIFAGLSDFTTGNVKKAEIH